MIQLIKDAASLFYPRICLCCQELHAVKPNLFCSECILKIPYTNHFEEQNNSLRLHFWGRVHLEYCAALVYFSEASVVQQMIHRLKYESKQEVADGFGKIAGNKMKTSAFFQDVDMLIPVPLHYKKKAKRGYNQSEVFARSIAEVTGLAVSTENLVKEKETESQTSKTRTDRQINIQNSLKIKRPRSFEHKHVLLLDDVVTTGATIEACAVLLRKSGAHKISLLSIAEAT